VHQDAPSSQSAASSKLPLVVFSTRPDELRIEPASDRRKWMDATESSFANRCLPLRIANQAGWVILNDRRIEASWNGGTEAADLTIRYFEKNLFEDISGKEMNAVSHFGQGILTWRIPYLFRTPPGYNLYVRGPTNSWKDGTSPLDAIIETDWAVATFTMNWKITRVGVTIAFEKGEPICMISPHPRGMVECFEPEIRDIKEDPETHRRYLEWAASRESFNQRFRATGDYSKWQKHYYTGTSPEGTRFEYHQVRMDIRRVEDRRTK
jgi:hypothetical protein